MSPARIRLFPEPVLRKKCKPVQVFDQNLAHTIQTMLQTMRAQTMGIGIAAPQIGIDQQIVIVDVSSRISGAVCRIMINPRILVRKGEKISHEGCMSLPDYTGYLQRFEEVEVEYTDDHGRFVHYKATGIEAVCIQHELDHLEGKLFIDRVTSLKADMIPRSAKRKKPRKT